jgi:hypothetical protein
LANSAELTPMKAPASNHFALDLGVDREDVVGALDAFVDGGERYVDLGEVNGLISNNPYLLGPTLGTGTRRR